MSNIKLVLTDLDGTVVQFAKHQVSDKVRDAVIACENLGVLVIPVTGRYYNMAKPVLEILGFDDLAVLDNGATIQKVKTGEVVWSQWLEMETLKQVATALAPHARIIDYAQEGDEHEPDEDEINRIRSLTATASGAYALVPESEIDIAKEKLAKISDIGYYLAPSTYEDITGCLGFHVTHKDANKFHGVEALRKLVGLPKEQTLAIGDGENDIALFENAGLSIAMGNASDALKAAADYVVADVSEDGFVEAMERFVLKPK
jgi:HAD superfamily hydrolase (TIGR01484 family)